ncbi:MAG: cytochrome C oxidase subunit IV family protein [Saprospiraceae bacterium]|nr:cytochrome C oxidase subunit IV family protein [Saprospiraceae bacterium]
MSSHSYEESKKIVFKGMILLGVITLLEVCIALLGNGHLIHGFELPKLIMYPLMIGLSMYKAYFIVYEFMHMRYEIKSLAMTVLLPTLLLVWAVIAFFQEGGSWGARRQQIKDFNQEYVEGQESLNIDADTKVLEAEH